MSDVIVAPRTRDLEELNGQLTTWLKAQMPQAQGLTLQNLAYPFGAGRSHETILFDAAWTEHGKAVSRGLVLRVKPSANMVYPDDLFEEQYKVMRVLHDRKIVPVAETLWFETDESVLGAPFFVMEKLKGRVAVSVPPYSQKGWVFDATPAQRAKFWENGVRALAGIQKTPLADVQFLAGPAHARSGLAQEWDKYSRFVEWLSESEGRRPELDALRDHLRARWPKNQPEGIVWGDARLGNLMYNDDFEVIAVMDWEQASLGGALNDLAWWLFLSGTMHGGVGRPALEGMGSRDDTIALWRDITGKSTDDLDWYEGFTALKIGCLSVSTAKVWGQTPPNLAHLTRF